MCSSGRLEVSTCNRVDRKYVPNLVVVALLLGMTCLTAACGAASHSAAVSSAGNSSTALTLSPDVATLASQEQIQFTASFSGTANTAVTWSASAGTISSSGFFTAPNVTNNTPVIITARSAASPVLKNPLGNHGVTTDENTANTGSQASATVTVMPKLSLAIATGALPAAEVSTPYTASLTATGGVSPYQWTVLNGNLPAGIQLQGTGILAGTTALQGSYPFTASVTDGSGHTATASLSLTVSSSSTTGSGPGTGSSQYDGPAELPRIYIQSAMADTPAPGTTTTVNAGGNVQSALNSANCGDTIQLQAGATFAGPFTLPAKSCDDYHWIIVRTSASDAVLPAEGSRLTPCYAGVTSLPGRPALNCASSDTVTAKLVMNSYGNSGAGPIQFATGANHYRLLGLELTRATGIGIIYALASVASGGTANNIIFDRVWMHGTAQDETNRGLDLSGTTYVSVINSYLNDFHCISITGVCGDAQAISGGIGSAPMGPYQIVGNFLEASGENILFGGGSATGTPADIQISQNHMFKPLTWMQGQPGYVGGANGNPFVVKNLFELKNAQRVLLDSNIMEDSWGGFSQVGYGILITPKNQSATGGGNLCPICQVTDVTIRYNSISHVGAGLQIANAMANSGAPLNGERYSVHDIVVDDIDGVKYDGPGQFAQVSVSAGAPLLQNVEINHITAFPPSTLFMIGDQVATTTQMKDFIFTNSIVTAGVYPVWSTGLGGTTNCAAADVPLTTFNACFTGSTFATNAIIASPSGTLWPAGNFFPASTTTVQFVNYNGGNGGNYELQPSSPYKNMGTDGKDLGADIVGLNSAIAGVE